MNLKDAKYTRWYTHPWLPLRTRGVITHEPNHPIPYVMRVEVETNGRSIVESPTERRINESTTLSEAQYMAQKRLERGL